MGTRLAVCAAGDEGLRASSAASWISSRLMSTNACICSDAIGHGACRRSHHRRSRFSMFFSSLRSLTLLGRIDVHAAALGVIPHFRQQLSLLLGFKPRHHQQRLCH